MLRLPFCRLGTATGQYFFGVAKRCSPRTEGGGLSHISCGRLSGQLRKHVTNRGMTALLTFESNREFAIDAPVS